MLDFVIVGGDMRMKYLYDILSSEGYKVKGIYLDNTPVDLSGIITQSVVLPVPCVKADSTLNAPFCDNVICVKEVISQLGSFKYLFGGMLSQEVKRLCCDIGVDYFDYMLYEPLTIRNAQATAEGALKVAIESTDFTLCGSRVLVAGYGRIGKILARYLKGLGADVTVEARKAADLALISANGYNALPLNELSSKADTFDIIFNTVPHRIFTEREIIHMNKNLVYIELASMPGGIDEVEAFGKKIRIVKAPSLPGKTAPKTAAIVIKDALLGILKEAEV